MPRVRGMGTSEAPFPLVPKGAPASQADWEKAAAAVLRKAGRLTETDSDALVWEKLTRRTLDGIEIPPLGTPDLLAGTTVTARPTRQGAWDIRASFADYDPAIVAEQVQVDLSNGATSVWLQTGAGGIAAEDLAVALAPVLLEAAPVVLGGDLASAQAFVDLVAERDVRPAAGTNLGADPIGAALRVGGVADLDELDAVVALAREAGVGAIVVDGTAVNDQGGTDVQELGWVAAVGAAYLRQLGDDALGLIEFRLAATDEQFPTIAKFRAFRQLWARVLELSGLSGPTSVHAVTSRPMMSAFDPYVNMLRTCVAAFAAGVGGADAVTVLPFDAPLGLPDAFSRRIARNTSSLLIAESHVATVADPAGGAYGVEKLTAELAAAAWVELGTIDSTGGAVGAVSDMRQRIAAVAARRDSDVATRKRPLTGLTEFPNLGEIQLARRAYADGALDVRRYGHEFEELRRQQVAEPVFLATMGPVAAHTARATFAANLLAAGGIDTVSAGATSSVDHVVAAAAQHRVVCLCGTDQAYAEWGTDLVAALRTAGATRVIVAGKADLGQDDSCAIGVDALDFLRRTREALS